MPVPQPQRPLVFEGSPTAHELISMPWQSWPVVHTMPQPPQLVTLLAVLTHAPAQQREDTPVPQPVPSLSEV